MYKGKPAEPQNEVLTPYGSRLPLYLDKVDHSPTGFAWGYGGSGPSQLAFAILFNHTSDECLSRFLYHDFKSKFVCRWDGDKPWEVDGVEIDCFIDKALKEKPGFEFFRGEHLLRKEYDEEIRRATERLRP